MNSQDSSVALVFFYRIYTVICDLVGSPVGRRRREAEVL